MEALQFTVLVALASRQPAVVADVGPPNSFLCFGVLSSSPVFFRSPCKQCSCLSAAASWRCWWWRPGELILAGRQFFLFSACFPSFALCFVFWLWRCCWQLTVLVAFPATERKRPERYYSAYILLCLSSSPPCLVSPLFCFPLLLFSSPPPWRRFLLWILQPEESTAVVTVSGIAAIKRAP